MKTLAITTALMIAGCSSNGNTATRTVTITETAAPDTITTTVTVSATPTQPSPAGLTQTVDWGDHGTADVTITRPRKVHPGRVKFRRDEIVPLTPLGAVLVDEANAS